MLFLKSSRSLGFTKFTRSAARVLLWASEHLKPSPNRYAHLLSSAPWTLVNKTYISVSILQFCLECAPSPHHGSYLDDSDFSSVLRLKGQPACVRTRPFHQQAVSPPGHLTYRPWFPHTEWEPWGDFLVAPGVGTCYFHCQGPRSNRGCLMLKRRSHRLRGHSRRGGGVTGPPASRGCRQMRRLSGEQAELCVAHREAMPILATVGTDQTTDLQWGGLWLHWFISFEADTLKDLAWFGMSWISSPSSISTICKPSFYSGVSILL